MKNERAIYIVFSSTHCGVGSFIRFVTGGFYNHVSVSFDENLSELYSFARFYKRVPLYGGFVHESGLRYRVFATPIKVCRVAVSDAEYNKVRSEINSMMDKKDTYIYNLASAAAYPLRRKIQVSNAFTCVEFAAYLLELVGVQNKENDSGFCSIENLEKLLENNVIYEDIFPESEISDWNDDVYNEKIGIFGAIKHTVRNNARLVKRMLISRDKS